MNSGPTPVLEIRTTVFGETPNEAGLINVGLLSGGFMRYLYRDHLQVQKLRASCNPRAIEIRFASAVSIGDD